MYALDAKMLYIYSIFTFPHTKNTTLHLSFKVSDGGYESDDESIWWSEEEQTEDIYNYGERLKNIIKRLSTLMCGGQNSRK